MYGAGAVGHSEAVAAPSFDDAAEAVTFGNAGDVDLVARLEDVRSEGCADFEFGRVVESEFLEVFLKRNARFGKFAF